MNKMSIDYWKSLLDEMWLEQMQMIHKGKDINKAIEESYGYLICDPDRLSVTDSSDFKRLINGWLSNKRPDKMLTPRKKAFEL